MAVGAELFILVTMVVAAGLVVGVGWFGAPTRDRFQREWADAHALTLTPGNIAFVRHYLTTGRRLRLVCVLGGVLLPNLFRAAVDPGRSSTATISSMGILVGYLVGTLWAELALTRPAVGGTRSASLAPRRVEDYLPKVLRRAPWAISGLMAMAWVGATLTRSSPGPGQFDPPFSSRTIDVLAVLTVVTAAGIESVQRWIVRRPQPMMAPDLVAADDAVRSQSLHLLGGTGAAILLCWLIGPLWMIGGQTRGVVATIFNTLGMVSFLAAIFFWRYYGNRAWRVRRPTSPDGPVVAAR